jgi:hypothetical protein
VSSYQTLLPTRQAEIKLSDQSHLSSLPVLPRWSSILLISPESSYVALPPLRLGQLSVLPHLQQAKIA